MHRKLYLRPKRIDHETVARVDGLKVSQIYDGHLSDYLCDLLKLGHKKLLLCKVHIDSFLNIRKSQNIFDGMIHAVVDELHHKSIV